MTTYYMNSDTGNDSADGLSPETAWLTPGRLGTWYAGLPSGPNDHTVEFAGDFLNTLYWTEFTARTGEIVFNFAPGSSLRYASGNDGNGVGLASANHSLTVNGNGLLLDWVKGNSQNAIGSFTNTLGVGVVTVNDVLVKNAADGASSHSESKMTLNRVRFVDCERDFIGVNNSTATLIDCVGTGASSHQNTGDFTATGCKFQGGLSLTTTGTASATSCVIGTWDDAGSFSASGGASVVDTFIHARARDAINIFGSTGATLTRCFGKMGMFQRGVGTEAAVVMRNCGWFGPPSVGDYTVQNAFISNRYSGAGFEGRPFDIRDTIFAGYSTTALGNGFAANQISNWNANSIADYCAFDDNGTNWHASLTTITNAHTLDPQIPSRVGMRVDGYRAKTGSPLLTAGFSGGEIGLNNGTNWSPSVVGY